MNELEKGLYRSHKTIREVCRELDLDFEEVFVDKLGECSDCGVWLKHSEFVLDLDENPICEHCFRFNGM